MGLRACDSPKELFFFVRARMRLGSGAIAMTHGATDGGLSIRTVLEAGGQPSGLGPCRHHSPSALLVGACLAPCRSVVAGVAACCLCQLCPYLRTLIHSAL